LPQIRAPLFWDDDDNNADHLWDSHQVTPDEVEEVLFGIDGEDTQYFQFRDGDNYAILGRTGGGRLLKMVGEFVRSDDTFAGSRFRVFHAMDMDEAEKRRFERAKKQ